MKSIQMEIAYLVPSHILMQMIQKLINIIETQFVKNYQNIKTNILIYSIFIMKIKLINKFIYNKMSD